MVSIKGSPKGIMILIDEADINAASEELESKLRECAPFFNEDTLEVFLTSTTLTDVEVYSLRAVVSAGLTGTNVTFIEQVPKLLPKQHSLLDELSDDEGITKFVRATVKSGTTLESEYNLIIIGDVEQGAMVKSAGNIFVLGSLLGKAHAGCDGKSDAVIVAMKLLAEEIRIAHNSLITKQGALKKFLPGIPEIAYIFGEKIKIEQYV